MGEWQDSKQCLLHDENGLFHHRLEILDNFYEEELLPFFSCSLGVSFYPTIEHYCRLWLDWVSNGVHADPSFLVNINPKSIVDSQFFW